METQAVWNVPPVLPTLPADANFLELAEHCEMLASRVLEETRAHSHPLLHQQLATTLAALHPTLRDPIPPTLIDKLTTDTLPRQPPAMDTESDLLCEYCLVLNQLLAGDRLTGSQEATLKGLLYELTCFLADTITAPRWLRTSSGRCAIN